MIINVVASTIAGRQIVILVKNFKSVAEGVEVLNIIVVESTRRNIGVTTRTFVQAARMTTKK